MLKSKGSLAESSGTPWINSNHELTVHSASLGTDPP